MTFAVYSKMRAFKFSVLPQYMNLCFHSCWPFVVLHCQAWKCLAVLFFFSFFYLVHSWKLLPPSLKHSCVFEAGEHPHTHTTTDPGSWLVLNPWQGALSLNIKDLHLRACRQDSHSGLSYSQQATWVSNSLDVAGATWGRCHVCGVGRTQLYLSPSYVNMWKSQQCAEISNRPICPTQFLLLPCQGSFSDNKNVCALFSTVSNHTRQTRRAE